MTEPTTDPDGDRAPTLHERLTGRPWDTSYQDGPAPWDTGRPQPAVVRLAARGAFTGRVLDAGCGTGENALHLASLGLSTVGVDVAETALAEARRKAAERRLDATFLIADALRLDLDHTFDSVLDCGLFHTFDDQERLLYVASLTAVTVPGATLHLLCFSDAEPGTGGPRRVSRDELRGTFGPGSGWQVDTIEADRFETRFHPDGAAAWVASIRHG
ncbi:class I SAM-dependent methyltransferase [Microlunatus speluncae]|uniref:class I SAM-dependent methyltransferase n=1 Tax=Microlunatus speluncae TaxID=2594267 RepID=UPI001582DA5F|nr:class I SAM-dependent methyltransferase [Microlunatus speluncae]